MDDSQELSYYEIALTNRQVLVFFVVLLLSVVGAFFSGVWLGQQRADGMPTVVQAAAPEEPQVAEEDLAQLNFFTDDKPPASSAKVETVAPAGSPETTLLEDVTGRTSEGTSQEPPKQAETPAATTAVPAAGGFVIQIFSSPDGAQARKLRERIAAGGFEAFLSPVEVDGRTMYRVRIGPFAGKSEAESTAVRLEKDYRVDTWVTRHE